MNSRTDCSVFVSRLYIEALFAAMPNCAETACVLEIENNNY